MNNKVEWDKVDSIISKWRNYNNKYSYTDMNIEKDSDSNNNNDGNSPFKLSFHMDVNLDRDIKVNCNTFCKKMKRINTMINSLCIFKNTIRFDEMIGKSIRFVDPCECECNGNPWGMPNCGLLYDTASKFDIQLNNCITINGRIAQNNSSFHFEMEVVINL